MNFKKYFILSILLILWLDLAGLNPGAVAAEKEDFKGKPPAADYTLGALVGLGVLDSSVGFAVMGTAAKKIIPQGFAPDINNQVFGELEIGPLFVSGGAAFVYSAHLRWDFHKDDQFSFYALGGLGGSITGEKLGSHWELYPRFGVGSFWRPSDKITLRAEISHELIVAGVSFPL